MTTSEHCTAGEISTEQNLHKMTTRSLAVVQK